MMRHPKTALSVWKKYALAGWTVATRIEMWSDWDHSLNRDKNAF